MEDIKELKRKKNAYIELVSVISDMKKYGYNGMDVKEFLYNMQFYTNLYPLPSGNIGNILAVAIECNYYLVAKCIIDNIDLLKLDLNVIAYDKDDNSILGVKEELSNSMLTMMSLEEIEKIYSLEGFSKYKNYLYKNEMAFINLKSKYMMDKEKVLK